MISRRINGKAVVGVPRGHAHRARDRSRIRCQISQ